MRRLAIGVALLALAGCGGDDDDDRPQGGGDESAPRSETTRVEVIENSGREGGFDPKAIYESEAPGVVTVVSLFGSTGLESVLEGEEGGGGIGSGFVLNGEGEIATNAHVVTSGQGDAMRRAREVYVEFADGNTVEAEVHGRRPERRHRAAEDRPGGPQPATASARREHRRGGRGARGGDRLAVRRAAVAVDRVSCRRSTARSSRSPTSASPARSRPTLRSTRATRAARSSTARAA